MEQAPSLHRLHVHRMPPSIPMVHPFPLWTKKINIPFLTKQPFYFHSWIHRRLWNGINKGSYFVSQINFLPRHQVDVQAQRKNSPSLLIQKSILPLPLQTARQAVLASHLCAVIYLLQIPVVYLPDAVSSVSEHVNTPLVTTFLSGSDSLFAQSINRVMAKNKTWLLRSQPGAWRPQP